MKKHIILSVFVVVLVACTQVNNQPEVIVKPLVVEQQKPDIVQKPNSNCVTKDRNGNCPPLPNSPRPTPKN